MLWQLCPASQSRSQYEVYSFATKNNLSEVAVDELLGMLSNECTFLDLSMLNCYVLLRIITYYTYYYVLLHIITYYYFNTCAGKI